MSRLNTIIQLGLAAARAEEVRLQRAEAHDQRNSCMCEEEYGGHGSPCWKGYTEGDVYHNPDPADFCGPCHKRQKYHEEFIRLGPVLAGCRSKVSWLAKKVNAMV